MPELPEVEIVKRGLEGAVLGQTVRRVDFLRPDLRFLLPVALPDKLVGRRLEVLKRRGKYILGFVESGDGFILHLGMSGVIKIIPPADTYQRVKHDHVVFVFDDGGQFVFHDPRRFGFLRETNCDEWNTDATFMDMGPEPLGNDFCADILSAALAGRRSSIKSALLNQKIVAGLGNIYVCEALYYAGISPLRLACDICFDEVERLVRAIRTVLQAALDSGGSSLKDYYHTDGSLGYFQHAFKVYNREGHFIDDRFEVKRIVQSGRSTFYCPAKQV